MALASGAERVATQRTEDVPTPYDLVHRIAIPDTTPPAPETSTFRFIFHQSRARHIFCVARTAKQATEILNIRYIARITKIVGQRVSKQRA